MAIKQYKPVINSRRHASVLDPATFSDKKPEKSLLTIRKRHGGRNNQGKITVRHHGGGAKRFIRIMDWKREKFDKPAAVVAIEYDPNRSAFIALLSYEDGAKAYILAPEGVKAGDILMSSKGKIEARPGNRMPLEYVPVGMLVHAIEFFPGRGGELVRSAGMGAQLLGVENGYAQIKLPSGESRMVSKDACATVGMVGNAEHRLLRLGKAGRMRMKGVRPRVRGKVMNPVDHPHGGGEGRNSIGLKYPKTPWGKHALGVMTRDPKKWTDALIIERRKKRK
jgi:large subunit ribosomal protein L2